MNHGTVNGPELGPPLSRTLTAGFPPNGGLECPHVLVVAGCQYHMAPNWERQCIFVIRCVFYTAIMLSKEVGTRTSKAEKARRRYSPAYVVRFSFYFSIPN